VACRQHDDIAVLEPGPDEVRENLTEGSLLGLGARVRGETDTEPGQPVTRLELEG